MQNGAASGKAPGGRCVGGALGRAAARQQARNASTRFPSQDGEYSAADADAANDKGTAPGDWLHRRSARRG